VVTRMEPITTEAMEAYAITADSVLYREQEYKAYGWRCDSCQLVWAKRWYAESCGDRDHQPTFVQTYGRRLDSYGKYVGGVDYVRLALRRDRQQP
jgi:hypothetical protein